MMKTTCGVSLAAVFMVVLWSAFGTLRAQTATQEQRALVKALTPVSATLESGIAAAEAQGTPISAKFEMDGNTLQLSVYTVYTMKGTAYSEVIVDYKTGKIAKTEPITTGEDFTAAKQQGAAMSKATTPLRSAVAAAVKANTGYRAVSAIPALNAGHPVATIELVNGTMFKTVSQKLD
jgi:hypothetical protein